MAGRKESHWGISFTVAGALIVTSGVAFAEIVPFGPDDARSVFLVAKSQNKNQVHYGVHLDSRCQPVGASPVFGYWRMLEEGDRVEPILPMEEPAYGVAAGQIVERDGPGTTIRVKLRAFPERPLTIFVQARGGRCEVVARSTIAGADARLTSIYVKLRWPFGVEYMLVRGVDGENHRVEEVIKN